MPIKDVVKVNRKTFFDPRGWLGYDLLKTQTLTTWNFLKDLFAPAQVVHEETFEQAMERMKVTEADIQKISQNYAIYKVFFLLLAVLMFFYGFFLLIHHHTFGGWMLSMAVTALLGAQAFRFSFWHFQIKHRKLGCTFAEWRGGKPFDEKEPPT